jgi:hypothetical protein
MLYNDCICANGNYKTIKLEFEVCPSCGNIINDGTPADTPFNKKQIEKYKNK